MILYAGTYGEPLKPGDTIQGYGEWLPSGENFFGGVFASEDMEVAGSHGTSIQRFEVDEVMDFDALRHQALYDEDGYKKAISVIKDAESVDDDMADKLLEIGLGEQEIDDEAMEALGETEIGFADWKCQGLAGLVAQAFGAQAVYLPDEHGYSVLVLPGAKILEPISD